MMTRVRSESKQIQGKTFSKLMASMASLVVLALSSNLTGCGPASTSTAVKGGVLSGQVMGGQQGVGASNIYLYAVGTGGDGSAAQPLLTNAVTTSDGSGLMNSNASVYNGFNTLPAGGFTITGDYTCPANSEVYIVSVGGNPGLALGAANPNLSMMAALGECPLSSSSTVLINELTTIGSIAPVTSFMNSYTQLGSSGTDLPTLVSDLAEVNEFVDVTSGVVPGPTLPPGYTASSATLVTLGDIVATCVNSGGNTGPSSACGLLFTAATPPGGPAPTDTVQAVLDILKNPTYNPGGIFQLLQPMGPFQSPLPLTGAPSTWALTINPGVGAASKLAIGTQPSNAVAGAAISPAVTVQVEDAGGNLVTTSTAAVTLGLNPNPASGTLSGTTTVNAVNGVATFPNLSVNKVGTGYTLNAISGSLTGATTSGFNITPGTATQLAFGVQPTGTAPGATISPAVTVVVEDAYGNTVTGSTATVGMAIGTNPGAGTLSGTTSVAAVAGVATFSNLSINNAGTGYTLVASSGGLTGATSSAFNVAAGTATKLVFGVQPSSATAGVAISPAVTVTVEDSGGNTVTTSTASITLAIANNAGGGTLSGTATASAVNGVATFPSLSINKTGAGYTLGATASGLTGTTSVGFSITAAAAAQVVIGTQPTNTVAGVSISPAVTATIEDAYGNTVTGSSASVTAAIASNPGSGTLSGTTTVTAASGVATFANLSINKAGTGYTLGVSSGGLTGATSSAFNITAAAASQLVFGTQPSTTVAGASITPAVTVAIEDAFGNTVTTSAATVGINLGANPGSGVLSGTLTTAAVSGVATFGNLSINNAGTGYTLVAASTGLSSVTSNSFNVTAGGATKLVFSTQPSSAVAGVGISPAVTVSVEDSGGNVVTSSTAAVTVAIANNAGGGTLSGTTTVNAVAGVATFAGLSINKVGTGYTLGATSSGLTAATSSAFNISAAAASQLVFGTQPSATAAGASISPAVTVTIEDAFGNTTTSTATVGMAIGNNPAGGTLSGTTSVAAVAGVATFANLSINNAGVGYTLTASSGGLSGATSSAFTITAGAPGRVVFSQQPTSAVAGVGISPAVTVTIQDNGGNTVTSSTAAVTVAISNNAGGGTLSGTLTVNAVAGVATFPGLSINKIGTGYTLGASSAGVTAATSSAFNITPAAGSQLVFGTQPSTTAAGAAISPAVTVTIEDAFGNVTTSTATVGMAIGTNPAGGALSGTTSVAAVNGVATFGNLSINNAGAGYTLTASSGGLSGATSSAFSITAGGATKLVFGTQPASSTAGTGFGTTVMVEDAGGNVVTTSTASVTVAIASNPGGGTLSGTATVSAVNGVATFSNLSINKAGSGYTLGASSSGLTGATSSGFNITAAAASQLVFTSEPASTSAGSAIPVAVTVEDAFGNVVTTSSATVGIAIGSNPSGGTLSGTTAVSAVNGIATFTNLSINLDGAGYTFVASSGGLSSGTSTGFSITSGSPGRVAFVTQPPASTAAGAPFSTAVAIEDAGGNIVGTSTAAVTISIGTNPGGGTLGGTLTVNAVNGIATFPGLSINVAGTGYTLTAASGGLSGATSNSFNITVGVPAQLVFSQQPTSVVAGASIAPAVTVTVEDGVGNIVATATNSVTVGLAANPGGGALGGTLTVAAVNGVATFSNLSLAKVGTGYTLSAASSGLTSATSSGFNVTPAAASQLVFGVQPTSTTPNATITPAVTVIVEDIYGNTVTSSSGSIGMAIGNNPASGTLSGTTPVSAVNGVATFSDLSINNPGTGYTLIASSAGLSSATSNAFNVVGLVMTLTVQGPLVGIGTTLNGSFTLAVPAPVGGLTVTLGSTVPGNVSISPATVNVAAGGTGGAFTYTGVSAGPSVLSAAAPGYTTATTTVTATTALISFGSIPTIAPGQTTSLPVSLAQAAPTGGLTVTLTSADPTIATVTGSVFIAAGQTVPSTNPQVTGVKLGTTNITGSGSGYAPGVRAVTVSVTASFNPTSVSTNVGYTVTDVLQISAAAPTGGLTFTLSTDSGSIATVPTSVTIPAGQLSAPVTVTGTGQGSTTLRADYPGVTEATSSVAVAAAPGITLNPGVVGNNLVESENASIAAAPMATELMTLTSTDPTHFLLSNSASTVGSASITVQLTQGSTSVPTFYIQGQNYSGTTAITASITATAVGFTSGSGTATLYPTGLSFLQGPINTTSFSAPSNISVDVLILSPGTLNYYTYGYNLGPQASPITVALSNTNTSVGTISASSVTIPVGSYQSNNFTFTPIGPVSTTIALTQPTGYYIPNNEPTSILATVTSPTITVNTGVIGNNLVETASFGLAAPPPTGYTGSMTITSSDPTHFLLTTNLATAGSASVTVPLTAGSTSVPSIYIEGQNYSGTTAITASLTASATGYTTGTGTMSLYPTGLSFLQGPINTTSFSSPTPFSVSILILSPGTLNYYTYGYNLGPQASPINFTIANSNNNTGTISGTSGSIPVGSFQSSNFTFTPLTANTTTISLTEPTGYYIPNNEATSILATVTAPTITVNTGVIGNNLVQSASFNLQAAPPSNITMTITSSDPTHFLLSTSPSVLGSSSVTVPLTAGSTSVPSIYVQGQGFSGTVAINATMTASAAGYQNGTGTMSLYPTGLSFLSGSTINDSTTSSPTTLNAYMLILNPGTLNYNTYGPNLGPQASPVTVSVTDSNPLVGSTPGIPTTIAVGQYESPNFSFQPLTAGMTTLTLVQPTGYYVPSNQNTVITANVSP